MKRSVMGRRLMEEDSMATERWKQRIAIGMNENYLIQTSSFLSEKTKHYGEWRRLHNEELHSLYRSPNIDRVIRRLRWVGHVARMEEG